MQQMQAEIAKTRAEVLALQKQQAGASAAAGASAIGGRSATQNLAKWGNQLQWTGRQLQYNFTLPILLAGGAATKFALDNERAFTRVAKVYGDTQAAAAQFRKENKSLSQEMAESKATQVFREELEALQGAFEALSSHYGVQQKAVLEVASAWAEAGSSGIELAKATELSLKASILGSFDAVKATASLIAIQSQYSLSTDQLTEAIATLNAVENQTGISMEGLIDGFARAAGVAREAGVDVRHLAAFLAAMTPAAGTAAQAGNALKTIISRLMSPTQEAAQIMNEMGLNIKSAGWQSANATERLLIMARTFDKLSDSQKQVASSVIASRWQINKFDVLMRELNSSTGFYQKALDATINRGKIFTQMQRELNTVLDSSPKRLEIIWFSLQNAAADIIQPMIPYIIYLAGAIRNLVVAFSNLDPGLQKFILLGALALAVVGPLIRYIGSTATLFYELRKGLFVVLKPLALLIALFGGLGTKLKTIPLLLRGAFLGAASLAVRGVMAIVAAVGNIPVALRAIGPMILKALVSPWGIAILAAIGLIYHFRDDISQVWNNIVTYFADSNNGLVKGVIQAWNLLPQGVAGALIAVVNIVKSAAMKVYELLQYLNPFAHHSPSLVENVQRGMQAVRSEFSKTSSISAALKGAYRDIDAFGRAVSGLVGSIDSLKHAEDRASIAKFAPGSLDEFDALGRRLSSLKSILSGLKSQVDAQQASVDGWTAAVKRANDALEVQQDKLDGLEKIAQKYQDQLESANQRLQDFARAPIEGMGAMEDQIFFNEMAQKKLRLEMMKMEEVTGPLDEIKSKIEAINGAQELLRGQQADLRAAGAGSEILKGYDQEIAKLEDQKQTYTDTADKIQNMQDQLDKLQKQAERMDLEKSLKFDPLSRAIDKAANSMKELPFDQIMAGIQGAQADVKLYGDRLAGVNAAIDQQKKAVEAASAARDAAQDRLDREQDSLDAIKSKYSDVEAAIRDVEDALNTAVSAASELDRKLKEKKGPKEYVSPGLQNFRDAAGGNFADVGGVGTQLRKDWSSQADDIKKFTDDLQRQTADMFKGINPFAPLKGKFNEFKTWASQTWDALWIGIKDAWNHIWEGVDFSPVIDKAGGFLTTVGDLFRKGVDAVQAVWRLIGPDIIDFFKNLWKGVQDAWNQIAPELEKFGELLGPLADAFETLWNRAKPVLAVVIALALAVGKIFYSIMSEIIRPFIGMVAGVLTGIIRIVRGILMVLIGIFTLNFGLIAEGVGTIFSGLWKTIWSILSGAVQLIWGVIKGFVEGVVGFFKWLWDELVGHSVVWDIVNDVIAAFTFWASIPKWIWDHILVPIGNFFADIARRIAKGWNEFWGGVNSKVGEWATWIKKNVSNLVGAVKKFFDDKITNIKTNWHNFWSAVNSKITEWARWIKKNAGDLLAAVKKFFEDRIRDVKTAWNNFWSGINSKIGEWGKWIKTNVSNLLTGIKSLFTDAVTAIGKIWDKVQSKISGPITAMKSWINNNLIDPLNKVVKLFGVTIPKLALGGAVTGPVGQGSGHGVQERAGGGRIRGFSSSSTADNIPVWATANEYMQPVSAVRHYGLNVMDAIRNRQIPKEVFSSRGYFLGGLIDGPMKAIDGWLSKGATFAVDKIMNPAIGQIGKAFASPEFINKVATGSLTKIKDTIKSWVGVQEKKGGESGGLPTNPGLGGAMAWARSQVGKPYLWGGVGPAGYDCSGFMSAIANYIQGRPLHSRRFATGSLPAGIFQKGAGAFSIGWFRGDPGHTAGTLNGMNVESRGGRGVLTGPGARGATDTLFNSGIYHLPGYFAGGKIQGDPPFDLIDPRGKYYIPGPRDLGRITNLANGALVRGGQGGTMVNVGEGTRDELVQPLPSDWRADGRSSGDTIININGNLEFPNVKSGDDVEDLIEGLTVLAGDYK